MKTVISALTKFILGVLTVGLLVFLPAGGFFYMRGWLLMAVLFVPIAVMGVVLLIFAPSLLQKRLDTREQDRTQRGVVTLTALVFLLGFVSAGLDYRFAISRVPMWLTYTAVILFLIGYALYAEVMRENRYLSRTVRVTEGQRVIDTGLYGVVRHPMYMASVIMFLMIPLILGSWISLVIFLCYPVLISVRIVNEEKLLTRELDGYERYRRKVKYRLLPFVW